ncbi:MAG: calcium-binding protein [Pleurocapsa sp.]
MTFLNGTLYDDDLSGNSTDSYVFGDGGNDTLSLGNNSNAILDGWTGNDTLVGNDHNNFLLGYTGNDSLIGGGGIDILLGEWGDDILNGYGQTAYEYDYLSGGAGADVFVLGDESNAFYQEIGYATIIDFDSLEEDKLQVFGSAKDYSFSEYDGGTDIYYQDKLIGHVADQTEITLENDFNFV